MRFSTRGRRRKFCDEGAALSPPPPPFSRVPSPPPSLPCLALLAWLSSCWYLHPIVAPTTFVSSSSFSLFLSLSFFLCFSLRLRPPSSAAPPGMLRLNSAPLAATAPRWPCCHPSVCTRPRMAIAEKARNDTATPPFCRDQASRLHRVPGQGGKGGRSPLSHSEPTPTASGPAKETAIEGQHAGFVRCRSALNYGLTDRPACRSCTVGGYWGGRGLPLRGRLSTVNCHMAI